MTTSNPAVFCPCNVTFEKDGETKVFEFCSVDTAALYVKAVVLAHGYKFISITPSK